MANILGRTPVFVDFGIPATLTIRIATDSGYTQNVEYIVKAAIRSFTAVYNAQPGSAYPYPTQTMGTVTLYDDVIWSFELQDADDATHANWRTGNPAACALFETELAASL